MMTRPCIDIPLQEEPATLAAHRPVSSDEPRKPGGNEPEREDTPRTGLLLKTRPKTGKPSMYKVLLLNDDYTPMDFVILVLERFFSKTREEAAEIMLHVHRRGVGLCGIYTYEIAETRVGQVMDFARTNEQPLQCIMEKE